MAAIIASEERLEIVGTCGISRNVSQVKQLLEEKELLLKEVHHRIKNNMNSMKSLVYLQRKSVDRKSTRLNSSHRV